jgi:hypothetical protein
VTFVDALATGRPMRRRSWWRGDAGDRWLILDADGVWTWRGGGPANPPNRGDLLADDWEATPADPNDVIALVRSLFEVYDRPGEPNGDWPHGAEYLVIVDRLRALVGAPPRRDRE